MLCACHCATRQITVNPRLALAGFCPKGAPPSAVRVFWNTRWRANQKDRPAREQAIRRGLEDYFAHSHCFRSLSIQHASERPRLKNADAGHERDILISVSELGPKLRILGSLWLLEGGTEVSFTMSMQSANQEDTDKSARVHSFHTGPWFIKGVKDLDDDLAIALRIALEDPESAEQSGQSIR